jgi:MFS family permease
MVVPFMTLYLVSTRGFSIVVAGEMLAGFGGGAVVAPLIGGALADRVGRRVTLLGGTLTTAAIMVALAYARLTALIVVLILLLGVTLEAPRPVTQALVADLVPEEDRARAYAALFWVTNLGFAAAMTSAGFLAQSAFTAIFWIDAGTGLLFGGLVWLFVPERPGRLDAVRKSPSGYRLVMRDRTMLAFTAAVLVYYFVYLQSDSTLPLAVHRSGLAPHVYGLCMAVNGVVICLAQPVLAPRLLRRDPGRVWAAGVALSASDSRSRRSRRRPADICCRSSSRPSERSFPQRSLERSSRGSLPRSSGDGTQASTALRSPRAGSHPPSEEPNSCP